MKYSPIQPYAAAVCLVRVFVLFCVVLPVFSSCSYTLKVRDGRTAFELKQYAVAIPMLQKEQAQTKTRRERGQLAYLLGDAYRHLGQDEKALEWFSVAYDNNYGTEALKAQAFSLKKLERYAAAREAFKQLGIEIGSPYEYRKEITACMVAEGWLKEAVGNGWSVGTASFNSAQNDFSPALFTDGRVVFTSDRALGAGKEKYPWTGHKYMDILIVEPDGVSPQLFDNQINTKGNEGVPCFNKTGTEMFFSRAVSAYQGDDGRNKIYQVMREEEGAAWYPAVPLPHQKDKMHYLHPALSGDGNTLYFACNDPDGWGGYDLYAMQRNTNSDVGWDEPKALSRNINSPGNELFPTFDADTLYFASDGLPGMGGMDIFSTYKVDRNAWAPPINLKAPVNSGADDFSFLVLPSAGKAIAKAPGELLRSGFFTTNRAMEGARGGDDICRFEQRVPLPKPAVVDTTPTKPAVYKMVLEGYVLEEIRADPADPNSSVLGRKPLSGAGVQVEFGAQKRSLTTKEDGFFTLELAENTDYAFNAGLTGYLSNTAKFSTKGIAKVATTPVQTFEIEIVLDKIYRNREIVLENIYYDYDRWDIRPDAEPALDRLAEVLRSNPTVRIQLGSHTDCRGNDTYNQTLSQRRAQSAVNYLISKSIDPNRLSAMGYGESQPTALCACTRCTEAEHQANRRTTFIIQE